MDGDIETDIDWESREGDDVRVRDRVDECVPDRVVVWVVEGVGWDRE